MSGAAETGESRPRNRTARSERRALALTLLLGAAGAGLAFLATRQGWAQVRTSPPRPLPAGSVTLTGAGLVPYSGALILAGLASLAAVLATRRAWRRVSGVTLAVFGALLAASAFTVSPAAAVAAAASVAGPASSPGAGSVTRGTGGPAQVPDLVGATPHVHMATAGWQALVVVGALAMIAAGVVAARYPAALAVMGGKYDSPVARVRTGLGPAGGDRAAPGGGAASPGGGRGSPAGDPASLWEALSRGEDPTAGAADGRAARVPGR